MEHICQLVVENCSHTKHSYFNYHYCMSMSTLDDAQSNEGAINQKSLSLSHTHDQFNMSHSNRLMLSQPLNDLHSSVIDKQYSLVCFLYDHMC